MNLTQREKLLLGVLCAVILLWVEYSFLLKGQFEDYKVSKEKLALQEQKLEQLNNAEATEKSWGTAIEKSMKDIRVVMDKYFTTTQQEETILLFHDLLADTGVQVASLAFAEPEDINIGNMVFKRSTIELSGNTTYDGLFNFMKKVWNFQKYIAIRQMSMDVGDASQLNVAMTLDLYYLTDHEGTLYKDNLYQMLTDENFFKGNPFTVSPGSSDFRMNYIFTGGKEPGEQLYTPFADISGHWAEKEINDFGAKSYVFKGQDDNFGPDAPMTRGEFIIMLDKIYQWPLPEQPVDLSKFSDYSNLGSYENAMSKAVLKGLLGGYVVGFTDQTLRPRDPITYEEVEFILQKIKNDSAFKWEAVGQKLSAERGVVSLGMTNKKGNMTKAESVFMMTYYK